MRALLTAFALLACACSSPDYSPPPCRTNHGAVTFSGGIGGCPILTSWEILPSSVYVGSSVDLLSTAAATIGADVRFTWTASPSGVVADPNAPRTTFTCTEPGRVDISIYVWTPEAPPGSCGDVNIGHGTVQCDPRPQAEGGADGASGEGGAS